MPRLAQGLTLPPRQEILRAVSLWLKQLEIETDHLPPFNAKVKNAWSYTSIPHISSWYGA